MTTNTENSNENGPENVTNPVVSEFRRFMRSHTMRFVIVGFITLVLLIPLSQIGFLIEERKMRQDDVISELKTEWGDEVFYHGLVIRVPVTEVVTTNNSPKTYFHEGYIYPEASSDEIKTDVSERYRGIFKANLFTANMQTKVKFNLGAIKTANPQTTIDWSKVELLVVTSRDTRFRELSVIRPNGSKIEIEQQEQPDNSPNLMFSVSRRLDLSAYKNGSFDAGTNAIINGSQMITVQSLAAKSYLTVKSNWNDTAFAGTSLPDNSSLNINEKGFHAKWTTLTPGNASRKVHFDEIYLKDHSFSDIQFKSMVDHYQLNERTIKYGILVLVLTFAVFFLIQVVGKVQVHPLHYLMVGLALLLFYSLLLSFSEHVGFKTAYIIAATTIIALIAWYARAVLQSVRFALLTSVSLGLLYAFLLVIVNLEVYALLVGSIGLLVVLAAIMSVTRKINFDRL